MDEDFWDNYETGPFCRHWGDPSDCDEICASCGHRCTRHEFGEPGECMEDGCDCKEWVEPDSQQDKPASGSDAKCAAD